MVLFTNKGASIALHYCTEPNISGYIACNDPDDQGHCVLCRIGRKPELRILLPVYLPLSGEVGVLPVSYSRRPHALRPQLSAALKSDQDMVTFIYRRDRKFVVDHRPLEEDQDHGEEARRQFEEQLAGGKIDLTGVYQRIPDDELATEPEISKMLELKEGRPNAQDPWRD